MKNLFILSMSLLVLSLGHVVSVTAHRCAYPVYYAPCMNYQPQIVYQEPVYVQHVPVVEYVRPVYVRPYRRYCRPHYCRPCGPRAAFSFSFGF